jgi:alkylated DNA repair protein (DNA oxidative demethylase)
MSQQLLNFGADPGGPVEVAPGAFWVPGWLDPEGQRELADACREWAKPPAGLRRPRMLDGSPFSTRAVCLGWHWYPYRYSRFCDDGDGAPVKPFPPLLDRLGREACLATGYEPAPFSASIVNVYQSDAKLGLHRDDGENVDAPVVTISLGHTCTFRLGNTETRTRPWHDVELASGDLFVFGRESRLAYHGVPRVFPGTAPPGLDLDVRISVTLRAVDM